MPYHSNKTQITNKDWNPSTNSAFQQLNALIIKWLLQNLHLHIYFIHNYRWTRTKLPTNNKNNNNKKDQSTLIAQFWITNIWIDVFIVIVVVVVVVVTV